MFYFRLLLFFVVISSCTRGSAQRISQPITHHAEMSLLGTFANQLEDTEQFNGGTNMGLALRYKLRWSPLSERVSFETGIGLQSYFLRQYREVLLGCNAPVSVGGMGRGSTSRIIGQSRVTSLTIPVGFTYQFSKAPTGAYLSAFADFSFTLGQRNTANLIECGQRNDRPLAGAEPTFSSFAVLPGGALGYQFYGVLGRIAYAELRVSGSLNQVLQVEDRFILPNMTDSGVLLVGLTFGQNFGGGKLERMTEEKAREGLKLE